MDTEKAALRNRWKN